MILILSSNETLCKLVIQKLCRRARGQQHTAQHSSELATRLLSELSGKGGREGEEMGNTAELVFVKWKGGKNKIQVSVELCQNEIGYVQLSPNHTLVLVVHSHMAEWQVA